MIQPTLYKSDAFLPKGANHWTPIGEAQMKWLYAPLSLNGDWTNGHHVVVKARCHVLLCCLFNSSLFADQLALYLVLVQHSQFHQPTCCWK